MATDDSVTRTLLIVIAAVLLFPFLMMALAMPMMGLWGWGHMWNGTGTSWMWIVMSIVPLLVIIGVAYLVYSGLRQTGTEPSDAALEELRVAYARGDLSDEEFQKRRERLERE